MALDLKETAQEAYEIAASKGFDTSQHVKQLINVATEVGEALECVAVDCDKTDVYLNQVFNDLHDMMDGFERTRNFKMLEESSEIFDTDGLGEELADIVIRVFVYAVGNGIDIENEIHKKMRRNKKRPVLHGKKF